MGRRAESRGASGALGAALFVAALLAFAAPAHAKRNVYVTGSGTNNIATFDIGADGSLTLFGGLQPTGNAPGSVALTPDGRLLFVANLGGGGSVSAFSVAADGALTPVPDSPFPSGGGTTAGVTVSPSGRRLYATNQGSDNVSVFDIAANGALTATSYSPIGAGDGPISIAFTSYGTRAFVSNRLGGTVQPYSVGGDGSLTAFGAPVAIGPQLFRLLLTPDGAHLYVVSSGGTIHGFDVAATGGLTPVPDSPVGPGGVLADLAITPDGQRLYAIDIVGGTAPGYAIAADGSLTGLPGSPFPIGTNARGVVATPGAGGLYSSLLDGTVAARTIAADGALAPVPGSPFASGTGNSDIYSVAITPNQGPTAALTQTFKAATRTVTFSGAGSTDTDGSVTGFAFDFGDGESAIGASPTVSHKYTAPGVYTATFTPIDNESCAATYISTGQTAACNPSVNPSVQVQIDLQPPKLGLRGKRSQPLGKAVSVKASSDEPVTATATGKLVVTTPGGSRVAVRARSFKLKRVKRALAPGAAKTLKLKPSKRARTAAAAALSAGGNVTARVSVTAVDAAGNRKTKKRRAKIRG